VPRSCTMPAARTPMATAKIKSRNFITPAKKRATAHLTTLVGDLHSAVAPGARWENHFEILIRIPYFH
jgi:hypothetical protein